MSKKIVIVPTFGESHLIKYQIPNIIDTIDPDYIIYNEGLFPGGTEGKKQLTKESRLGNFWSKPNRIKTAYTVELVFTKPNSSAWFRFAHRNIASHPLNILEIVDRRCLVVSTGEVNKAKAALTAGFTIERQGAFLNFSILAKKMNQVFTLRIPG